MTRSKTVGFVTFKREGKSVKYLLLHHGSTYWNFPKGTVEKGEEELETAKRELFEETGIKNVKVYPGFRYQYDYDFDTVIKGKIKEKVHRTAVFFLAEVKNDYVKISDEHFDFGWFDYDTAFKRMFFQESQNLLKKAHQFILKQQDIVL